MMAHAVTHFEILAAAPDKVIEFYQHVFGWSIEKWDGPVDYWLIDTGSDEGGIDGAIMTREGDSPASETPVAGYICTIEVDSIDDTLDLVVEHGGELRSEPQDIPGVGRHAYCTDPDGNQFGVMEPTEDGSE